MAEKLGSCEWKSTAISDGLLRHPLRSFRELFIDYPGLARQVERRLGWWWIESDVRAFEVAKELGSLGIVHAGLMAGVLQRGITTK